MGEPSLPDFMISRVPTANNWENTIPAYQDQDEKSGFHRLCRFSPHRYSTSELTAFDLKPPPPTKSDPHCEIVAERLFSADHLQVILKDPAYFQRFRGFLAKYQPQSVPTLTHYLESQKALTAIRYANAIAGQLSSFSWNSSDIPSPGAAGMIDKQFEASSKNALDELVADALPTFITHRVVTLVTECLVKEITGSSTPLMREFIHGLAEVYCLTDARQPDNPTVFASEEFYSTTQYGREYVIGKNCRFLQGPKTQKAALKRIADAIHNGQEANEILLNYRRDGSPFLNLLMVSPLMDSRGQVRYYIGAHVDVSHLLEAGRGLDSFRQLLDLDTDTLGTPTRSGSHIDQKRSLSLLHDLSSLLNEDEADTVKTRERETHMYGFGRPESMISIPGRVASDSRRFVGMEENEETHWSSGDIGTGRRVPGVYQNYILVRPYPSLRITFTSPSLRIPGLCQSKLMDRIGGPQHVREGVLRALAQGIGVTAKISWLTQTQRSTPTPNFPMTEEDASIRTEESESLYEGRPRCIHCTPLMGSDMKPGVIMIVMVDKEEITGTLAPPSASPLRPVRSRQRLPRRPSERPSNDTWPVRNAEIVPLAAEISATTASKNPYAGCLMKEASGMPAAEADAIPGIETTANSTRHTTASTNETKSTRSTLTRRRKSSGSFCSRGNGLQVTSGHATNAAAPREGMSGMSLMVNERDSRDEGTSMLDRDQTRESYPSEDSAKEFVFTGVGVVPPERVESKKIRTFEALLKRHKKSP